MIQLDFLKKNERICKFFLAKRLGGVYIDKANTLFAVMKIRSLQRLFCAFFAAASLAYGAKEWAPVANRVAFSLDLSKAATPDICAIRGADEMAGVEDLFKDCKIKPQSGATDKAKSQWFLLNIPVRVYAMGTNKMRELAPARYIRELKVTVYLLVHKASGSVEKGENSSLASEYNMIKKEITFVDIPLEKGSVTENGREMGKATMCVGVFIPKSTASILTGNFDNPKEITNPGVIAGYAVLATVNGEPCSDFTSSNKSKIEKGETRSSKLFDKKLVSRLGEKRWWEERSRNKFDEPNVDICSIAESPYAPFYGKYYPRVKPMYGTPLPEANDSLEVGAASSTSTSTTGRGVRPNSDTSKPSQETSPRPSATTPGDGEDYDSSL